MTAVSARWGGTRRRKPHRVYEKGRSRKNRSEGKEKLEDALWHGRDFGGTTVGEKVYFNKLLIWGGGRRDQYGVLGGNKPRVGRYKYEN